MTSLTTISALFLAYMTSLTTISALFLACMTSLTTISALFLAYMTSLTTISALFLAYMTSLIRHEPSIHYFLHLNATNPPFFARFLYHILQHNHQNGLTCETAWTDGFLDECAAVFQACVNPFYPHKILKIRVLDDALRFISPFTPYLNSPMTNSVILTSLQKHFSRASAGFLAMFSDDGDVVPAAVALATITEEVSIPGTDTIANIEVSSNKSDAKQLLLQNGSNHWESNGFQGSHWIRVHLHANVHIKHLVLHTHVTDSYKPKTIKLQLGSSVATLGPVITIQCSAVREGSRIPLLNDAGEYHQMVQIGIEADGINCKVSTREEGLRADYFGSIMSLSFFFLFFFLCQSGILFIPRLFY